MEQLIINAIKNYGIEKAMGMFAKDDVEKAVEKITGGGIKGNSFIKKHIDIETFRNYTFI